MIHGCYDRDGNLKVIDTGNGHSCAKGFTPLPWNQTGPQGAIGPQGPAGAQGPAGSDGASPDTYWTEGRSVAIPDNQTPGAATNPAVVTLTNLPAGKYLVNASSVIATTDHTVLYCQTYGDPLGGSSLAQVTANPQPGEQIEDTLSVSSVISLPNGGGVALHCGANSFNRPPPSDATQTILSHIIATKIGALTAQ